MIAPQAAGTGVAMDRLVGVAGPSSVNSNSTPSISNGGVLLDQSVLSLGRDLDQRLFVQVGDRRQLWVRAADEFRLGRTSQILRHHVGKVVVMSISALEQTPLA